MEIVYRALKSPEEMERAVDLQKNYWGEDGLSLVPSHMLLSMANYGGQVLGAYDGERLVGVLMGFIGADISHEDSTPAAQRLLVMSKRMIVLPEYRSHKIGEQLKQRQRQYALQHGIPLVTWTFDPLLARNAYLNIHKLGAIGQHYQLDYFGAHASNPTLSADRLVANWWVAHPHLERPAERPHPDAPCFNRVEHRPDFPVPHDLHPLTDEAQWLLEIPADFHALQARESKLSAHWRAHIRQAMQALFGAGYLATDVIRYHERVYYVFTRDDGSFSF